MEVLLPKFDPNDDEAGLKLWDVLSSKAGEIQQQVLREILRQNSKTEYLSRFLHKDEEHSSCDGFLKKVPVVGYDDVKSYIERVCNGEPFDIISSQPIIELLTRYLYIYSLGYINLISIKQKLFHQNFQWLYLLS